MIKPNDIKDIVILKNIPQQWWDMFSVNKDDPTPIKGKRAEIFIRALIAKHKFPEMGYPKISSDINEQHAGIDIAIEPKHIQVKCDYEGGEGNGCTGNLYVEYAEKNLYKQY